MKLCKDCEHARPGFDSNGGDNFTYAYCAIPMDKNLSTGGTRHDLCNSRRQYGSCGGKARDFVPRVDGRSIVVVQYRPWWKAWT